MLSAAAKHQRLRRIEDIYGFREGDESGLLIRMSFRGEGCKQLSRLQDARVPGIKTAAVMVAKASISRQRSRQTTAVPGLGTKTRAGRGNYSQAKLFSMFESEETRTVAACVLDCMTQGPGETLTTLDSVEGLRSLGHACPVVKIAESRLVGPSPGHDEIGIV